MLKVSDIEFSYRKKKVLCGLSFSASKGECIAIAGANGCGKSTLLSILSGASRPSGGSYQIAGQDALKNHEQILAHIGYVPQENPLIEELSVMDNLYLWYHGSKKELRAELGQGILNMLSLQDILTTPVRKLSGGTKKRVSIACALSNHPEILVLDEPGAALDLACKTDIRNYLVTYLKNGGTVILTTHEEAELSLCTRLLVMHDGKLREVDSSLRGTDLLNKY